MEHGCLNKPTARAILSDSAPGRHPTAWADVVGGSLGLRAGVARARTFRLQHRQEHRVWRPRAPPVSPGRHRSRQAGEHTQLHRDPAEGQT